MSSDKEEMDGLPVLAALRERTNAIEPSRDLMFRLQAIPGGGQTSGWGAFVSAIASYALPSLAVAGGVALALALVSPSADLAQDDDLASAIAMEVAP